MDRVVTSKVSLQYKAMIPALIVFLSFFAYLFIEHRDHGDTETDAFMTKRLLFFSILVIVLSVSIIGVLFRPQKITISGYGILMHGNIAERQLLITRNDVQKLYVMRNKSTIKGAVDNSSTTLCIELKDGKEVGIGETSYENYESLKFAVYEYLQDIGVNNETAL